MRKQSLVRMLLLVGILQTASNIAHPFTPKMFTELGLPDYMFGVAFASMSLGLFVTAPLWGKMGDRKGRVPMLALGLVGYAVCQFLFSYATTVWQVVLVRFVSGLFSSTSGVSAMAYIVDGTTPEQRSRYMSYYAAANSTGACAGFFVGGVLGDFSIKMGFLVQAGWLLLCALSVLLLCKDYHQGDTSRPVRLAEINPFRAFIDAKYFLTPALLVFFMMTFLINFGIYGYDNAFNYFIKKELDFPSTYNGIIKAVVGIVGLILNFTLNIWLARRTNLRRSLYLLLFTTALTVFSVIFISSVPVFVALCTLNLILTAISVPMQQFLATKGADPEHSGIIVGVFNAFNSVGMMAGSLVAGFTYDLGPLWPFIVMAIAFLSAALLGVFNCRQFRQLER